MGAQAPPLYNLMRLPGAWRDDPQYVAAVSWRQEAARRAGLTVEVERPQFERTPHRPRNLRRLTDPADDSHELMGPVSHA
ncbi:hypothetical protein [Streptomyces sp. NPDC004330]|uniref:hypothetical protein n=1 Tax=Streptomyces sp. NPDC004330 TaxID=3364700 RepID=UPI00368E20D7